MNNREFWMVWCERGGPNAPTVQHDSEAVARKEAERLARNNKGQRFWVLRSVGVCTSNDVQWDHAHVAGCNGCNNGCDDCIPF